MDEDQFAENTFGAYDEDDDGMLDSEEFGAAEEEFGSAEM
jgi:Ca2+-binding EF-hand superfamily protein